MPYHVRITINGELDDLVALDLSHADVIERVVTPYEEGRPIVLKGRAVDLSSVKQIRISHTHEASDRVAAQLRAKAGLSSLGGFSDTPWSIAAAGDDFTDKFIKLPPGTRGRPAKEESNAVSVDDSRVVMVVHGRDVRLRDSLFEFLRSIDLRPLEWSEAVAATEQATPYVGDVLDAAFSKAQAVVVLFTGDDIACLRKELVGDHDKEYEVIPTPQARPNVLFEAGMAMARHPERTLLIEIGTLRPFSDIGGRHVVRLDHTSESRAAVIQRLETAGCTVNRKRTDWIKAGDFSAAKIEQAPSSLEQEPMRETYDLSDLEREVLLMLSKTGEDGLTGEFISSGLQIAHQKAKYILDSLDERKLVTYALYVGAPTEWHLAKKGRKLLVEKGLL